MSSLADDTRWLDATAQAFGTKTAVIGGGVATLGIVAVYSIFFPTLRRVDRFEDLEGHGDEATP